jgi:3-(3-hydroxy-phenyl)propionate hydroxylase
MKKTRIIIAGGGPVGVVSALACAQHGYAVTLLETDTKVDDNPRAATTHPSTLEMIARVGLIDQFIQEGLVARYFQFWDKPARAKIVEFDHDTLRDETPYPFVVQTEQHKLARMGIERLRTFADADLRFGTRATGVTQDAESATVTAEGPDGWKLFAAITLSAPTAAAARSAKPSISNSKASLGPSAFSCSPPSMTFRNF